MNQSSKCYTKNDCTKEEKIPYELFLDSSLLLLGFNYSSIGTIFYKEILKIVYIQKYDCIKLDDLFKELSTKHEISIRNIQNNIHATFRRMDTNIAKQNFKNIFGIDYNNFFITPKNLIVLFLNTMNINCK